MNVFNPFDIVGTTTGWIHTLAAILAMLFGAVVILNRKGTKFHKRSGYAYVISMLVLNVTAFGIYNFGGFSLFHFFALISLASVVLGMIPAWTRRKKDWKVAHYYFMSWSVVGLYAAFWSEVGTRMFDMAFFWWAVMLATMITCGIGAFIINREAKKMKVA